VVIAGMTALVTGGGSGICINEACSLIVTPHHVTGGRGYVRASGVHPYKITSVANKNDQNKSDMLLYTQDVVQRTKIVSYNVANDISFLYTKRQIKHKAGVTHSYNPQVGHKVTIAGYYNHKFITRDARIIGINEPITIGHGQLTEDLIVDIALSPGFSGSAVFDEEGSLLGMIVSSVLPRIHGATLRWSVALPLKTIAAGLIKLDPVQGRAVFGDIPEEATPAQRPLSDYQELDLAEDDAPVIQESIIPELAVVSIDDDHAVAKMRAAADAGAGVIVGILDDVIPALAPAQLHAGFALAVDGAHVTICGRTEEKLAKAVAQISSVVGVAGSIRSIG